LIRIGLISKMRFYFALLIMMMRIAVMEFKYGPQFQIIDNIIWAGSDKLAKFDTTGKLLKEKKFKKGGFGYRELNIVDEQKFIARYTEYETTGNDRKRKSLIGLIDSDETKRVKFSDSYKIGAIMIIKGDLVVMFSHHSIAPGIVFAYDRKKKKLYMADNEEYKIEIKNLEGKMESTIHRQYQNYMLTEADKEEVFKQFKRWPPEPRKMIRNSLPNKTCVIHSMALLPNGHLAVKRITGVGLEDIEIDIFNPEGKYIYKIFPSEELPDLSKLKFFKDKVALIKEIDERDILIEYQITNLPGIY